MTGTKRWNEADSDVSDTLRALMRHARAQKPDEAQLASLTAAVLAELPAPTPTPRKLSASVSVSKLAALGLVVALGGAGLATYFAAAPTPPPARTRSQPVSQPQLPTVVVQPLAAEPRAPIQATPDREMRPRSIKRPDRAGKAEPTTEISLLQAARTVRAAAPERALVLLSEHASRFPDSMFSEEREALRIEILQRARPAEAAQRLRDFERRFPGSVYRQRIADSAPAR